MSNIVPRTPSDTLGKATNQYAAVHAAEVNINGTPAARSNQKLDDFGEPDDNTDLDATTSRHGLMSKADKVKLNGIETGATADQSAAEITVAYNSQVPRVSSGEINNPVGTEDRRYAPADVAAIADKRIADADSGLDNTAVTNIAKAIKLDDFGEPDDNTDLDATTSRHGLMSKADKVKLDSITAPGGGVPLTDGDKGDIQVSGNGSSWGIKDGVVTTTKMAAIAPGTVLGRVAGAGVGSPAVLSDTQLRGIIDFSDKDKNPMTAAGDLIVGGIDGAPLRLPKGPIGKTSTFKTTANGVEWVEDEENEGGGGLPEYDQGSLITFNSSNEPVELPIPATGHGEGQTKPWALLQDTAYGPSATGGLYYGDPRVAMVPTAIGVLVGHAENETAYWQPLTYGRMLFGGSDGDNVKVLDFPPSGGRHILTADSEDFPPAPVWTPESEIGGGGGGGKFTLNFNHLYLNWQAADPFGEQISGGDIGLWIVPSDTIVRLVGMEAMVTENSSQVDDPTVSVGKVGSLTTFSLSDTKTFYTRNIRHGSWTGTTGNFVAGDLIHVQMFNGQGMGGDGGCHPPLDLVLHFERVPSSE